MGFSSLTSKQVLANSSNYTKGRAGYKICKFTPHHMAGKLTGEQCAKLFQNPGRNASANYCIGYDGEIIGCVDENNRAWTSNNKANDCQAITVEVSNSSTGGDWPISEASWNALVELAVDVCKRYNFKLVYDGTANGSLTRHNMFAATACPGTYLQNRFEELARVVNARLEGNADTSSDTSSDTNSSSNSETSVNYLVKVTASVLNIRKGPGTNYDTNGSIKDKGTYTIVAESDGQGASKWGKLKSGAGWISLDYVTKQTSNASANTNTSATPVITKGCKVKFTGTKSYSGITLASWTKNSIFDVIEVSGDRVVIGKGTAVTAAVNAKDCVRV